MATGVVQGSPELWERWRPSQGCREKTFSLLFSIRTFPSANKHLIIQHSLNTNVFPDSGLVHGRCSILVNLINKYLLSCYYVPWMPGREQ